MTSTTTTFGTLTSYATGEAIRPARADEWLHGAKVVNAGTPQGFFESEGRTVFVDGGPRAEVDDDDIRELEQEAGDRDAEQVALCQAALGGGATARAACAEVILSHRVERVR